MLYYEHIFKTFQKYKLRYLTAGGMAVNLHGVPRFTKDLDILIDTSPGNLRRLRKVIGSLRLRPRMPVTLEEFLTPRNWVLWARTKNLKALNLFNPKDPYEGIDILWGVGLTYEKARRNRRVLSIGRLRLFLVSIPDLIAMKKKAGRQQDLSDVEALQTLLKAKTLKMKDR